MLSCDTFALGKDYFTGHQTFLCKNSDRPLGEAQPLLFGRGSRPCSPAKRCAAPT